MPTWILYDYISIFLKMKSLFLNALEQQLISLCYKPIIIAKELSSSSSYSFHFSHLYFNCIMKNTISSYNMPNPTGFYTQDIV